MIDEAGSYYVCTETSPRCFIIQKNDNGRIVIAFAVADLVHARCYRPLLLMCIALRVRWLYATTIKTQEARKELVEQIRIDSSCIAGTTVSFLRSPAQDDNAWALKMTDKQK
ncbi:hypothetical protein T07_8549 [Trichinella nelsoni]|uniref:Uncharacterized protein n=1 Tax=Trichinella nelsoni TaxID=6336 RepID=A0A0V0RWA3_9BILA|nr:hypothetical protein T07_8549 [Trichinella nelsoni]